MKHAKIQHHIEYFYKKHNVRPYTLVLLVLLAVTNNALAAAQFITF